MPFTPSHIAAVLPLRRRWKLFWPALVIGSMAPDMEYFLTLGPKTRVLHTFPGVIFYTLPGAFFVLWLFEVFLKEPVFELMPEGFRRRATIERFRILPLSRFAILVYSIAVGIATHLLWDAFTHSDSPITDRFAWFMRTGNVPIVGPRTHYNLLQYLSTVLGLAVVALAIGLWYWRTPPSAVPPSFLPSWGKAVIVALLVGSSVFIAAARIYLHHGHHFPVTRYTVVLTIVTALAFGFWEVLAFSVLVQARRQ